MRRWLILLSLTLVAFRLPAAETPALVTVAGAKVVAVPNPDTTVNFDLTDIVRLALRDNPDLKAFRARREASLERSVQVGALPNPMFNFGGMLDRPKDTTWPETKERRMGVEQEFPGFGKRDLRAAIARQDATLVEYDLERTARQVVSSVKEAYFDLVSVQRAMAITRQDGDVLARMARLAGTLYAAGSRPQDDVIKAQSEVTLFKQRLTDLEAREKALKATLNALVNRRPEAPLVLAATFPMIPDLGAIEGFYALASANRPEIRAAEAKVERYELERQSMARASIPDYKVGFEYRRKSDESDGVMLTLGMGLPFWRAKNDAGVREAEKMKAASESDRETAQKESERDVQQAYARVIAARRTFELYQQQLVPQAEARFKASEAAYQSGRSDFLALLDSQRTLLNAHILEVMAQGDVGTQFARLERAVGVEMVK